MKAEVTIYCDSEDELREFADRILSRPIPIVPTIVGAGAAQEQKGPQGISQQAQQQAQPAATRQRKPRSDAGQPRGPYKTNDGAPSGGQPASGAATPGTGAGTTAGFESPRPSPQPAAPAQEPKSAAEGQSVPPATPAAADSALTEADVRAALKVVSDTAGLGMQTCMGIINSFGVDRISSLPKDQYAAFKAKCEEIVANHAVKK